MLRLCRTCNSIRIISILFDIASAALVKHETKAAHDFWCAATSDARSKSAIPRKKNQMADCFMHIFAIHKPTIHTWVFVDPCTVRTRSAHINRETIVRLRRRQRHHPNSHRAHTKNVCDAVDICTHLLSIRHSTFGFCVVFSAFCRILKFCVFVAQWKREATQTICLMRYLQMLWRVETMLEICLKFVPLYRFLNLHKQRFSCQYFCRRFERGRQHCTHQTTHLQIVDSIFYLLICVCFWNSIGSDRWLSSSREHLAYIMGISGH